ncbi:MAG TPA: hypothetical protein VHA06_11025, partial [Candidatus Angelobacter sp.]|nr:hypothetical protein [Candidatus Angelobacter sp.]
TFLEEQLDVQKFAQIKVRPLFCSDIEALEMVTGHFRTLSLPQILEQWFTANPSLFTPISLSVQWKENEWLVAEWKAIFKKIVGILFPDTDQDIALAEAIKRSKKRQ